MVKQNPLSGIPTKPHSMRQDKNPFGHHDKHFFTPHTNYPVRCQKCSNLMASDFLSAEGECPNCHWRFTKADARDMFIEAMSVRATHGGWNPAILEELSRRTSSYTIGHDPSNRKEIGHLARDFTGWALSNQAEMKRRAQTRQKTIDYLRSQSAISKLRIW